MCLLHYIVLTIRQKFPELLDFDTELFCIDKAAQVSLENVIADVFELEKGMDNVRKEADVRNKGPHNHILKDFLTNSEEKLRKMRTEAKNAQEVFKECVEYFGESSRNTDANTFFSLLVRFVRAVKVINTIPLQIDHFPRTHTHSEFEFNYCYSNYRPLIKRMNNVDDWIRQLLWLRPKNKMKLLSYAIIKLIKRNNR